MVNRPHNVTKVEKKAVLGQGVTGGSVRSTVMSFWPKHTDPPNLGGSFQALLTVSPNPAGSAELVTCELNPALFVAAPPPLPKPSKPSAKELMKKTKAELVALLRE